MTKRLQLRLLHGDARFTGQPVLLGHYQGDTLVSAEAQLDERLRGPAHSAGPLSRLHRLGLYPGALGSHAVLAHDVPGASPPHVAVAGLGEVATLTAGALQHSLQQALLALAQAQTAREVACLLIGTGDGQLRSSEAIEAAVTATLAANRLLVQQGQAPFTALSLLTLFEDAALAAAHALHSLVQQAPWRQRVQWAPRAIETAEGHRKRRQYAPDPGWWQRWVIEQTTEAPRDRLRFVALGERARAEALHTSGQLALADDFVQRCVGSVETDPLLSRTLTELLLPEPLRHAAPQARDRLLLLDEAAARFPWEMLQTEGGGEPPAVQRPLLRQLRADTFRAQPQTAPDTAMLVIGHPDLQGWLQLPELPGARSEAEATAALARRAGVPVTALVDAPATETLQQLHARGWRLLHLAGHGLLGAEGAPSGLAIGPGAVLSPGDVAQLRWVPEFVFINACHQGQIGAEHARPSNTQPHRLAATLGAAFIRLGARAVVCAGWAVHDDAALAFATPFYRALLAGAPFAQALHTARRACWQAHPQLNTWGAYQAYGDPSWRLKPAARSRAPKADSTPFFLPQELRTALENLGEATRARSHRGEDAGLRQRLRDTLRRGPRSWRARGDVAAALGFCYSEAGLDAKALLWLQRSLRAPDGEAPLRAAERAAQAHLRLAALATADGPHAARALAQVNGAMAALREFHHRAPSPRLLLLLAQAEQVRLWLLPMAEQGPSIEAMAAAYRRAWDADPSALALAGWCTACWLWAGPGSARLQPFQALLAAAQPASALEAAVLELARWLMDTTPADLPTRLAQTQAELHHPRDRQRLRDTLYFLLRLGARHLGAAQLQTLRHALQATRPSA